VSEQVNRKCLQGMRLYNVQPPTPTLSLPFKPQKSVLSGKYIENILRTSALPKFTRQGPNYTRKSRYR